MTPRLALAALALIAACRREPPAAPAKLTPEQQDRRDLVRRPKGAWTPGAEARRLSILLLTDRAKIRKGERFHYRLELRNEGREPISFIEAAPSFVKDGSLCAGAFSVLAAPPGGQERALPCAKAADGAPGSPLSLSLPPGDYLLTRGSAGAAGFRDLLTPFAFDSTGTYRLRAVYAPAGGPRAESNAVAVEVVP